MRSPSSRAAVAAGRGTAASPRRRAVEPLARSTEESPRRRCVVWSARRDDVARQQRHVAADVAHQVGHREDHVRRGGVLHGLAVDAEPQAQVLRVGDLVGGHEPRTERGEGVEALALQPLAGALELEVNRFGGASFLPGNTLALATRVVASRGSFRSSFTHVGVGSPSRGWEQSYGQFWEHMQALGRFPPSTSRGQGRRSATP